MKVTLFGKEHDVVPPRRYAETRELVQLAFTNTFRGAAAVLAYCVPTLEVPQKLHVYGGNVAAFGGDAWEHLHKRGLDDVTMVRAAQPIVDMLSDVAFPTKAEVDEQEVFTGARAGGPTTTP